MRSVEAAAPVSAAPLRSAACPAAAPAAGFAGLKGHRSVGGLRASIYNAFPPKGVDDLVAFMADFQKKNG